MVDSATQQQVTELLKVVTTTMTEGREFVLSQAGELAQQIIWSGVFSSLFGIFVSLTVIAISWLFVFRLAPQKKEYNNGWHDNKVLAAIIGGLASTMAVLVIIGFTHDLINMLMAPKLYILKYVAGLIK